MDKWNIQVTCITLSSGFVVLPSGCQGVGEKQSRITLNFLYHGVFVSANHTSRDTSREGLWKLVPFFFSSGLHLYIGIRK